MANNNTPCQKLDISEAEFDALKREASFMDRAIQGHHRKAFTIVEAKSCWKVFKNGVFLNCPAWLGHQGVPTGVPAMDETVYLANARQFQKLGIEPVSEECLRKSGFELSVEEAVTLLEIDGNKALLPAETKIEAGSYSRMKKALIEAGASYQASGFVFDTPEAAIQIISALSAGERPNLVKEYQFYQTTDIAGDKLLAGVDLMDKVVFEPSAGDGYLVRRALKMGAKVVKAAEVFSDRHGAIRTSGGLLICKDVFDVLPAAVSDVDAVLMNPPFKNGQDVEHVSYVESIIPKDAEIHAIMSIAVLESSQAKQKKFRSWMTAVGAEATELPEGTFADSGTNVRACVVKIPSRAAHKYAAA